MTYSVKEVFYTLQGEGAQMGRAAVFLRFAGCNLWSGREQDRDKGPGACSKFCDTDFVGTNGVGGGRFRDASSLAEAVSETWSRSAGTEKRRFVVCTGGEPLLQLDAALVGALHERGFSIAVETNGTIEAPAGIDWLCVSPKTGGDVVQRSGNELKLLFPQEGSEPARFEDLAFDHFFLQPIDGPDRLRNTKDAIAFCMRHPQWRLSVQSHKFLGIP